MVLIDYCPSVSRNDSLHCIDFGHLAGLSPGFYVPNEKYNNTADVIGILNAKNTKQTKVKRLILYSIERLVQRYNFTKPYC